MQTDLFYRLGEFIYKCRWFIIFCWIVLLLVCIPFVPNMMKPFKSIGFVDPNSQSALANKELNSKLGYGYNQFIVMYKSNHLLATSSDFKKEIESSLADLKKLPAKHQIIYPDSKNKQISTDKHSAYAVVLFQGKSSQEVDEELLKKFKSLVKQPPHLTMYLGGEPIFLEDTKTQTQRDLFSSEYIGTPVTLITMLIVFESVVAACIPVFLGGVCALIILTVIYCIGLFFSLSVFTINIALLLGLCLSLDYSLLFIYRFRRELKRNKSIIEAIAITQTTAGKAVFFSGLAVFISLSALLLFPINYLFSVGVGGLAAVLIAVMMGMILLPAILTVLGDKINLLPIRFLKRRHKHRSLKHHTIWYRFASHVVKKPYRYFLGCLIILLLLGYPFLNVVLGISDFRILPKSLQSRQVFDMFKSHFGESKLTPVLVVIKTSQDNILTKKNVNSLYHYSDKINQYYNVDYINSIVNTSPRLSKTEYEHLYSQHQDKLMPSLKKLLVTTTHKNFTVMSVIAKSPTVSPITFDLITKIRNNPPGNNLVVEVTGASANIIDVKNSIERIFPYALLWIIGFTYLILLIVFRSIVLPLKAIIMTILSLCASYGVLVLVFQEGYLHNIFNFEPQGILDISLLIIIFCALFGISMDYEVFLLSSIKECYERAPNQMKCIALGIDRSRRVITSAAIIVIAICLSFMFAEIVMVKAFGLGIAIAVFVDAFIIRIILVPSTMALMKRYNWYLPQWLSKILPKITFSGH